MLSSVWNKFVPGGRSRQTHEAQQTALEIRGDSLSTAPNAEVRGENAGASVSPAPKPFADHLCNCAAAGCKSVDSVCICSVQQPVCTCLVSGNDCASDNCGCIGLRHGHSCANCSCVCSNREPNGANVKIDHSDADGSMADYGAQQCSGQQQSPTEVHSGPQAHRSKADRADIISRSAGSDCLPAPHSSSCDMNPLQDHQKTASHEGNTQHQQHWSASSSPLPVEKGSAMSNRSDSGHPEGWEHIRSDDIQAACMRNEEAMQTGNAYGDEPRRETVTPGEQDWRTNKASGSIAGWNSPPPEFEFVADGPWCDVSRLLRLSSRQQPRGWEWACSGLASALLRDRSNSNNHAEAVAALGEADDAGEDAAVAAASERTGRQGCPVVRLLRSAMYSTMFSGSEFIRRHGTLGKATAGTEANSASESPQANPTGWGGRWQLTPFDYPRDSFTSCSSSDSRRGSAPVPPVALSVEDGESSSGSQGSSFESHSQLLHGSAGGSDAVRPRSPVGSPSLAASSGTQRGTLAADEGNATVYPDSAHVASEAQQHIETQCRKKLKKNDMRLNILITALPGVDTDVFCRQMFAEWQEVSRQRVSCGEEFVFRSPFVVPFVEVPVIAATSFASALPYCELRLLEEWTRDAVLQQEATERRVHICLFLIPHLALPLSTGVLALLKRLRAVACMLPLLIVQQTTSNEQILRDAVHLPLVLQLPLNGTNCGTDSRCTCGEGIGGFSEGVTTPLSLRGMLVEASAVLLRQRAEYGCFLPFLFQQQMLPNRTNKLRGLQQWEDEEKQQREQQQHVEALVDLRQVQIDTHPNTETAMHMQRQLDGLRKQLRKMQQQLLHLQERRFLQELLREEAAAARPYPSPHGRVLLQNSDAEPGEREELLSQVAQTGLVLALMLGVGALLFNSMKRGSC
ncbi:uncharacterized protein EMH_0037800 [Eimeria mitis]|uniref:Uncharacterized protein n=1 Tax=Eimeria mitis TaxID=44415 RepID=U6KIQ7_9EIME|nr:uncharacterized protein EMH_0037800 [Eimeria mitis]CDJ36157.1 hypothetical protein, conserved [Eimeria mitis]